MRFAPFFLAVLPLWGVSSAQAQVAISEVLYDPVGVNTGRQVVEISNYSDAEVSLAGYWLYFPPSQWQFPPEAKLPPRGTAVVYINRPGKHTESQFFTGISGIQNLRAEDAVALFRSNLFSDPSQIADFVQWGSSGHGAEHIAVSAGIWPTFGYIDTRSLREGSSLAYDGFGETQFDWCIDGTPTLGAPNDSCTPSFAKSFLALVEIGYFRSGPDDYHPAIEISNVGEALDDLGGKWVVLGGVERFQFPLGNPNTILAPGERAVLHVGVDGANGPLVFYTGAGALRDFRTADCVSLHAAQPFSDATTLIDFVQWGAAGGPLEDVAVAAGLWAPGEFVDASRRIARGSFVRISAEHGAAGWGVDNTPSFGKASDVTPEPSIAINEILIDPPGVGSGGAVVELKNVRPGEDFVSEGLTLCAESASEPGSLVCCTVAEGTVIPAGGFLVLRGDSSGPPEPGVFFCETLRELSASGGVLLLSLTPEVLEPDNLIDYVRWGNGSLDWEALADSRGLWPGDFGVSVAWARDNCSIAYYGSGRGADAYRVDCTPSLGSENAEEPKAERFRRGDCNDDGKVDISDPIRMLGFLFLGLRAPLCRDACDPNDDGANDISDPVYVLNYLFSSGPEPAPPGARGLCGGDPTSDPLTCDSFLSCPP